jgi:hypothetical protein
LLASRIDLHDGNIRNIALAAILQAAAEGGVVTP